MIVHYNKIDPKHRTLIRSIEAKAYVGYIRYLLLKRWNYERVRKELMRLGLAWNEQHELQVYFQEVLYPVIQKNNLASYYKKYRLGLKDEVLQMDTFGSSETNRIAFIDLLHTLDVVHFFAEEIVHHYGGIVNIPNHPLTGQPLIPKERPVDLVEMLQNPRRHVIEQMLLEGFSPKQITEYLFQRYDTELSANEIKVYAKSFFNVKRQDIQRLIDTLQTEKEALERKLTELKHQPPHKFSFGERFEVLSAVSSKIEELSTMIRKLNNVHSSATFNAAVLEVTDIREMFKDVMVRAHRRFRDMDERTEDEVVGSLNSIVAMMAKATDKIIHVEDILNQKATKSINEEMLEVIMPTLDRIEEEEREAMYAYKEVQKDEDDDDSILGFEY